MKKLIIFGTENLAEITHHLFTYDSDYKVAAFTVDAEYVREDTFCGFPVVPFEQIEASFPAEDHDMFVAMGIREVNQQRARKVAEAESKGYRLASFVSSKALTGDDLKIGPNSMVMELTIVHPFATIGRDSIIWGRSQIAYYSKVGDHCWIVCAITGESTIIGDYTFIGLGATIAPFVSVGKSNVIGAGALILRDTEDFAVYKGAESRPSRVPSNRLRSLE